MQFDEILKTLKTKEERILILDEIRILTDSLYKEGDNSFESVIGKRVRKQTSDFFSGVFTNQKINKEEYFQALELKINEIEVLEVSLAYIPSANSISLISNWITKNLGSFLIDFKYDPTLIAGGVIIYKGKYLDLSLRKKFEDYFQENYTNLMKFLN